MRSQMIVRQIENGKWSLLRNVTTGVQKMGKQHYGPQKPARTGKQRLVAAKNGAGSLAKTGQTDGNG